MDGVPLESSASSLSYLDVDNTSPVAVTGDTNLDDLGKDPRFRRLLEAILFLAAVRSYA
jgi:hypothetical protein